MSKDRDFDGHLTFEEFMGEETPVEKAFKNMDEDGDGLVSKKVSKSSVETFPRNMFFKVQVWAKAWEEWYYGT